MQIDIVDAGAAIQHAVINNEAFKMQYAECFTGIHRHAINGNLDTGILFCGAAVPVRVGIGCSSTNAPTLCAMPVNQHANIEFRALTFGIVQGLQNHLSGVVLLKVQRDDTDSARGAGDFCEQRFTKICWSIKKLNIINRLWKLG